MYGGTGAELDKSLKVPIKRGEGMARKLVADMGCPLEVAKDLTVLTLYDVAILIDDSDSMISGENGQGKTLIQFIDHITEIYSMANESGILALRFNNYGGAAMIGTELKKKILYEFAIGNPNQKKPLLVLIVTAGVQDFFERRCLGRVARGCVGERERAGKGRDAVSFQFSLMGNDPSADTLLHSLYSSIGGGIGKYIDVLPVDRHFGPQLVDKWFVLPKILVGAILPSVRPRQAATVLPRDKITSLGRWIGRWIPGTMIPNPAGRIENTLSLIWRFLTPHLERMIFKIKLGRCLLVGLLAFVHYGIIIFLYTSYGCGGVGSKKMFICPFI
ncbi:hypothetical protein B9Z19DRAFT_1106818 [Tuber borchii]|uniref:VWFA domain-containing protein n=1 Tax=Tuber borchii TaxID=42251 RepID=A0A2T6ZZC8_TUBBO|nr:hypothetical protein B9Z19DRAFT_1106818 [Tuber borchii]